LIRKPVRQRRAPQGANGTPALNDLLATLRSVWESVETQADRDSLHSEIATAVEGLKHSIEGRLSQSGIPEPTQHLLFPIRSTRQPGRRTAHIDGAPASRFTEPSLRVYAKDFADHALQHLPQAANYQTLDEFRNYLSAKLRFNSVKTRRRTANYIISRFFPDDVYNSDLPAFAAATAGTPSLGEALFYLTCRTERIVSLIAEELVYPSLPQGGVSRSRLREAVEKHFPGAKSVNHIAQAIVRSYEFYGLATANRTRLNVSLREGNLVSFAYILHLEYPEPGMYTFEGLCSGPMHKWLLWDQQWMVRQLYQLREAGLLSKVSEIDRLRQYTTKYSLADAMPAIVALAHEGPA
jgi:hypothetical protein